MAKFEAKSDQTLPKQDIITQQRRIGDGNHQGNQNPIEEVSLTPVPQLFDGSDNILRNLLMYGGIAVAIIIALSYFVQTLLQSITELLNAVN